jgi:PAS domain S-box-containing protein
MVQRKKTGREIAELDKFPSENPNTVLRVDETGTILFSNPAGQFLLREWNTKVGDRLPERITRLISDALASERKIEFEESFGEQTCMFVLAPIIKEGYVNIYGIDITVRKKAEEAMRKSEERYRSYVEATGELGWTTNAESEVVEDIPTWRNFTGQTFEEIKGSGWTKALHPDDLGNTLRVWRQAIKKKSGYEVEYRVRRRDGVYRHFMARGVPLFNKDGSVREWVGTCIDITERKKAEELLLEQSMVIGSAPDAIISTDSSFVIKSWNKAAEQILGWMAAEVIGKASTSIFNIVYPTLNRVTREQALKELMNTGFWKGEVIYHKKDGSPIPVSVSVSLVKDRKGDVSGTVAVVHDISKRKRRVKFLKETRRDLNRAQAVAKTGSWRLNVQRNVLLWSDENHRIFGVPKGTAMTYGSFLEKVHPEDRKFVDRKWKAALRGEPYDIEHRIIVDGEVKWVRERAELEFDSDGTLLGGFGATQEITDLVEMRQKLEDALVQVEVFANQMEELAEKRAEELKDTQRLAAIGATAGMVGHDLRNPLQAIVGDLYLLGCDLASMPEGEEKEGMKESIAAIKKSVDYIDKIIQDLQDYARPIKPAAQETDFEELCSEVLFKDDFPENIDATYWVDEKARKVIADPELLRRILTNLINNAVQAMPDGGRLEIQACEKDGDFVITVQDSGVGISKEIRPKLFMPLFTTKSKGQGFGLAVVKRLTEALGGTVTLESEEGKGTKFLVRLPQRG